MDSTPENPEQIAEGPRRGRPPGKRNRPAAQIRADRRKIKKLSMHGYVDVEIAEKLGLSTRTVRSALTSINRELKEQIFMNYDMAMKQQLKRIDLMERDAHEGLERAKKPATVTTTTVTDTAQVTVTRVTSRAVSESRQIAFLRQMARCVELRSKILGLYGRFR